MKIPYFKIILLCITVLLFPDSINACTSAIITAKASASGKPLLWKHRDTGIDSEQNKIVYFTTGKYAFLALVNTKDVEPAAWTGTNEVGFSIMNTASYNLKDDDVKEMDHEGVLMYRALECCASLSDFEMMLDTLSRPMRVEANFGVIDAQGGAAYYEVNNHSWTKRDANDPKLAPDGYLIYTNYSFTGRANEGSGYIRYQTAVEIFEKQAKTAFISPQWIFKNVSRSFYHSLLGYDLCQEQYAPEKGNGWFIDQDFIPRRTSSCSIVIEGVNPGENPLNTVMWTVLGYPPTSVCVPLWVKMKDKQPVLLTSSENGQNAELCTNAIILKHKIFPIIRGNGEKYFQFSLLFNSQGSGYMQKLGILEDELFKIYSTIPEDADYHQITELYTTITPMIRKTYFPLIK